MIHQARMQPLSSIDLHCEAVRLPGGKLAYISKVDNTYYLNIEPINYVHTDPIAKITLDLCNGYSLGKKTERAADVVMLNLYPYKNFKNVTHFITETHLLLSCCKLFQIQIQPSRHLQGIFFLSDIVVVM